MIEMTRFFVLGGNTQDERFYAIFTADEYKMFHKLNYEIEWVGQADSKITAAMAWLDKKKFNDVTEDSFLDSFDDYA